MKQRFAFVVAVMLGLLSGLQLRAAGPEEDYVQIYNQIQEADRLAQSQRFDQARETYLEARARLGSLSRQYPEWNPNIIRFRLGYINRKLAALPGSSSVPESPATPPQPLPVPAPTEATTDRQLEELRTRVRELETEKSDLSARLREALAARPAAVDPQELAVAEAKVLSQQKEIELLRVNLEKLKSEAARTGDPSAEGARQALAEAQRELARQAEQINILSLERTALQSRLLQQVRAEADKPPTATGASAAASATTGEVEELKRQLETLHQQLGEEQARNKILLAEKRLIERSLNETGSRANNASLAQRLQMAEQELEQARESSRTDAATISALQTALASANQEISSLQGRLRSLQPQSSEARLEAMLSPQARPEPATPATVSPAPAAAGPASENVEELKARLAILEARRVPYAPEELALFHVPEITPVTNATARATPGLSRDTAMLVAEAEKDLRAGRFAEAERKYQDALASDQNNVIILSSLASAQVEQGSLPEAERTVGLALARDPSDAFSLFVLGRIRVEQGRLDEAITALSRSAYLDGSRAETFNLLGIVLGRLGLREPAETALRRAVQLLPNYASAHHNLAVVYSTQTPPALALARWHYEKAIAGGHRPDPAIEARLKAASNRP
jgi:hypothetical protein